MGLSILYFRKPVYGDSGQVMFRPAKLQRLVRILKISHIASLTTLFCRLGIKDADKTG